jgi:hypothetical protein
VNRLISSLGFLLLILPCAAHAQCPANAKKLDDDSATRIFGPYAKTLMNEKANNHEDSMGETVLEKIPFLESWAVTNPKSALTSRLADLELDRWNKETSSGSGAAGKTSVASQGSVASLFSFAVENGALTRSESGTTITFRTSPANVLAALRKGGWMEAGPSVPPLNGSFESIAKRLSAFVSFDASRGNSSSSSSTTTTTPVFSGDKQQISGWGVRYEILNKRDPRRAEYRRAFADLAHDQGRTAANQLNAFASKLRGQTAFQAQFKTISDDLLASIKTHSSDEKAIVTDYANADAKLRDAVCALGASDSDSDKQLYKQFVDSADAVTNLLLREADIFNDIANSWTLAAEYNVTRQANTNGSLPTGVTPTISTTSLPNLGNINLVASKGFSDGPQFTGNAGFTWFQSLPTGSTSGRMRDVRVSAELDIPLPQIKQIGKPTVSVSGLFLSLLEQPLGQAVLVNTVAVTRKGNLGLVQGKFTIPTKGGVSIPISLTWASRTELIKESDVRGSIGITFDLDKLFAKGESK